MKKTLLLLPFLLFIFIFTNGQVLEFEIEFNKPLFTKTGNGLFGVEMEECFIVADEGFPALPVYSAEFLLPMGNEAVSVEVSSIEFSEFFTGIDIAPSPGEFPISVGAPEGYRVQAKEEIYNSSEPYPKNITGRYATHFMNGHSILSVPVFPVQIIPAEKKARYVKKIVLSVKSEMTSKAETARKFLRHSTSTKERIHTIVSNPQYLESYDYPAGRSYPEYDILLISDQALMPHFDDYIAFKESTGFLIKTVTIDYIYTSYPGADDQEKIRNCIIDSYTNDGIEAVILGGDGDPSNPSDQIIPHRGFYVAMGSNTDSDIASDIYYSNLDGNWNDDGDNRWGEPGEDDLFAEVAIGRLCVDNSTEIMNMTGKLISYQDTPVTGDIEKALMIGESLDSSTWGGDSKDEVADGSSNHGFTTAGFPANFSISYLYERDMSWNRFDIFDQFNNTGLNLLNHLGHSNVYYNMKMNTGQFSSSTFTNDGVTRGYVIGYSQGCYNGSFDNRGSGGGYDTEDCFAEKITTIATAQVATVANSRYGWYQPGGTNASSQYFDRQFFDAIFGEDITQIGWSNADSKEDNVSFINSSSSWRWCCYELNLFGDPTMDIWTTAPSDITVTHPAAISVGAGSLFIQTDAPGSRIALVQDGEVIGRGLSDANGTLDLQFFDPLVSTSPVALSVTAHNRNRYQAVLNVISNQPYVVFEDVNIDDNTGGNGNGMCDYGESVFLSLDIVNIGMEDASDVDVTIHLNDPFITLLDSTENYGYIAAGDTGNVLNGFNIAICDFVPNNHSAVITVEAVSEGTWTSYFNMDFCAPELALGTLTIFDTISGDGDGHLEPGETADIVISSANNGMSDAFNAEGEFSTFNGLVTIINGTFNADTLPAGTGVDAVYRIAVSPVAQEGLNIQFENVFTAGNYLDEHDYFIKVGMIFEDWESNSFNRFEWEHGGDQPWTITQNSVFEGSFSALSGNIGDEENSILQLTMQVNTNDSLRFRRRVSSEAAYDWLKFYIDNDQKGQWSGDQDWEEMAFAVNTGEHTFKWEYEKDQAVSGGTDQAWIDFIIFPDGLLSTCQAGPDLELCEDQEAFLDGNAYYYEYVEWMTSGTGTFSDTFNLETTYYPGEDDIISGEVTMTLEAVNFEGGVVSDNMVLTFDYLPEESPVPDGPAYVDLFMVTNTDYTIEEVAGAASYEWFLEPGEAGSIDAAGTSATIEWSTGFIGQAYLSAQAFNDCGEGDVSEPLEITVDNTVGVGENSRGSLQVYPNPAEDVVYIRIPEGISGWDISLVDLLGHQLVETVWSMEELTNSLDVREIEPGVYFIVVRNEDQSFTRKLIIR